VKPAADRDSDGVRKEPELADSGIMFRAMASAPHDFPSIPGLEPITVIGRGAYSTVWSARQSRPVARIVAVKVLDADHLGPEPLARFLREWDALARAAGTGVASLLDAGHASDGRAYLVMEFIDGEPITMACDRRSMPLRERLRIAADLAGIVARIHARGLVHRDLKPSNVLVHFEAGVPIVTVLDFGLARIEGVGLDDAITLPGAPIGTPEWMAPEQTGLLDEPIDSRADVHALGLIIERLWVGRPRWARDVGGKDTLGQALKSVVDGGFAPTLPPEVPPHWDDLSQSRRSALAELVAHATNPTQRLRLIDARHVEAALLRIVDSPIHSSPVATWRRIAAVGLIGAVLVIPWWLPRDGSSDAVSTGGRGVASSSSVPGSLVIWGQNDDGRCTLPEDRTYTSAACGPTWTLAVDDQGRVIGVGADGSPPLPVPDNLATGADRVRAVATRADGAVALLEDGRVQTWGPMDHPDQEVTGVQSVACGRRSIVVVRLDGTIGLVAHEDGGMKSLPALTDVKRVVIAHKTAIAITGSGACFSWGSNETGITGMVQGDMVRDAALAGTDSRSTCFLAVRTDGSLWWAGSGPGLSGVEHVRSWRAQHVVGAKLASWFMVEHVEGGIGLLGAVPKAVEEVPDLLRIGTRIRINVMSASTEHAAVIISR